jgi:hypothetical protein
MKTNFLTLIFSLCCLYSIGQDLKLQNIYWSRGSLLLENQKSKSGFTAYYPGHDVVFFKDSTSHEVKTYHLSKVRSLRFYDNGIREIRQFVRLEHFRRHADKLFELISLKPFHILRLPHPQNFRMDDKSRMVMDHDRQDNHYTYYIVYEEPGADISPLPASLRREVSNFIRSRELDCYAEQDLQRIKAYCRRKALPILAVSSD